MSFEQEDLNFIGNLFDYDELLKKDPPLTRAYWAVYRFLSPLYPPRLWRRVIWFKQRLTRGFGDPEVWSLDHSFAVWIVPRLEWLRQNKHGIPCAVIPGQIGDYTEEDQAIGEAKWHLILDQMILGFTMKIHEWDDDGHFEEWWQGGRPEYVRAKKLFAEWLDSLWD